MKQPNRTTYTLNVTKSDLTDGADNHGLTDTILTGQRGHDLGAS